MGRSRGPQLDQDVQEAAHMLAEGCGTPVSAAVSAALDAQRAPGVPGGSDPRTGAGERGHRHAAQRDPRGHPAFGPQLPFLARPGGRRRSVGEVDDDRFGLSPGRPATHSDPQQRVQRRRPAPNRPADLAVWVIG